MIGGAKGIPYVAKEEGLEKMEFQEMPTFGMMEGANALPTVRSLIFNKMTENEK